MRRFSGRCCQRGEEERFNDSWSFSAVDIPASDDVRVTEARRRFYGSLLGVNVEQQRENTQRSSIRAKS